MGSKTNNNEETQVESKVKRPSKYKVFLLNDDFTPMDFVVKILMTIFNKDQAEAQVIMMNVHHKQKGLAGIYVKDIAEDKVSQVHVLAKSSGYPLKCIMEKE